MNLIVNLVMYLICLRFFVKSWFDKKYRVIVESIILIWRIFSSNDL